MNLKKENTVNSFQLKFKMEKVKPFKELKALIFKTIQNSESLQQNSKKISEYFQKGDKKLVKKARKVFTTILKKTTFPDVKLLTLDLMD